VGHVKKEFHAKEPELIKYLAAERRTEKHFIGFSFRHIPRSENSEADELAKVVAQKSTVTSRRVLPSINHKGNQGRRGPPAQHTCHHER